MRTLSLVVFLVGCKPDDVKLGGGLSEDARFMSDVFTWRCQITDTFGGAAEEYEGVYAYKNSLEYAPDNLQSRELPTTGCARGVDVFPVDAGEGGTDIPDVSTPTWANGDLSGAMGWSAEGYYAADVYADSHTCGYMEELIGDGTLLSNAGAFSGARTPAPGSFTDVTISGDFNEETGIAFGAEVDVSWEAAGWDGGWIQVRRESGGVLNDSVTCNTSGMSSFTIDQSVWGTLNAEAEADVTNLYVSVQNQSTSSTADGQKIDALTRVMHIAVVK